MGRQIHGIVLILLSICEVWMCYQVLYRTVLEKEHLRKWQKVLIWGNILGAGIILGINRKLLFSLLPCLYSLFQLRYSVPGL